jgi:hypothetical protein
MISTLTLAMRLPSSSSLVETLAPPTIAASGRAGASSALPSAVSSASARPAKAGRTWPSPSVEACAVGGGKGVVDEDVAELGEFSHESGIVLLLARMEAGVFQAHDATGLIP